MTGRSATSHELNNMLAKIVGAAELALDQPMPEEVRQELRLIVSYVQGGAEIVRQLKAPARAARAER